MGADVAIQIHAFNHDFAGINRSERLNSAGFVAVSHAIFGISNLNQLNNITAYILQLEGSISQRFLFGVVFSVLQNFKLIF